MQNNFEQQLADELHQRFSNHEPLPGHEERFETRLLLKQQEKKLRHLPRWPFIVLAAASVAALIVTLVWQQMVKDNEQFAQARLSDVSYEMAQVEQFYTQRIKTDMPVVEKKDEVILRFQTELQRLEEDYLELETALSKNFSNQFVIDGMVENYRYRLQIIEMMQHYIEIQNSKNNNENETGISS